MTDFSYPPRDIANALEARFGSTPPIMGLTVAKHDAARFAEAYPDDACLKWADFGPTACFVRLEAVRAWFYEMTPDTRAAVLRSEVVMGWFVEDSGDEADADGDFMSTPGCDGYDALEDIWDDLEHCSRCGLLSIERPMLPRA